jgi:hypothetical protein
MVGQQADLHSVASLERLAEQLKAAPAAIDACLRETEDTLLPRLRRLERAVEHARDTLRRAERALEATESTSGDDDDSEDGSAVAAAEAAVEEARANLARIENAVSDVKNALGRYKAAAADLSASKSGVLTQGAAYVSERVKAAREYLSLQSSGENAPTMAGLGARVMDVAQVGSFVAQAAIGVTGFLHDVGVLNNPPAPSSQDTEPLQQLVDQRAKKMVDQGAEWLGVAREAENQTRRQEIETAERNNAGPRVELFDPNLESDKDRSG